MRQRGEVGRVGRASYIPLKKPNFPMSAFRFFLKVCKEASHPSHVGGRGRIGSGWRIPLGGGGQVGAVEGRRGAVGFCVGMEIPGERRGGPCAGRWGHWRGRSRREGGGGRWSAGAGEAGGKYGGVWGRVGTGGRLQGAGDAFPGPPPLPPLLPPDAGGDGDGERNPAQAVPLPDGKRELGSQNPKAVFPASEAARNRPTRTAKTGVAGADGGDKNSGETAPPCP